MKRFIPILAMTVIAVVATFSCSDNASVEKNTSVKDGAEYQYAVLNPWADIDPVPRRGISPRVDSLSGKKIGLFANFKRAARPIQAEVEKRLKERFPDIETTLFDSSLPNVTETETANKEKFAAWSEEMDAVVAVVGD